MSQALQSSSGNQSNLRICLRGDRSDRERQQDQIVPLSTGSGANLDDVAVSVDRTGIALLA